MTSGSSGQCSVTSKLQECIPRRILYVRRATNIMLAGMSHAFDSLYSAIGRPWIASERLLRALILPLFFTILMEQLEYNLLFRWLLGLSMDDEGVGAHRFHKELRSTAEPGSRGCQGEGAGSTPSLLIYDEHFIADGTFMEAWASPKASVPKTTTTSRGLVMARTSTVSGVVRLTVSPRDMENIIRACVVGGSSRRRLAGSPD